MGATNNSVASNFVLGMANLIFQDYTIQRWQIVLVAYLAALLSTAVNIWGSHLLHRLSKIMLCWNVASFIIITIVLLATNNHKQSTAFVFSDFQNMTGWGSGMASIIGILQSCFGMCCYDAPSHMTEEMKSPSKEAPRAIVLSVALGAVTGLVFLLTLCFCIGDIATTADSSTRVPVIQIIYDSTRSKTATCILSSMITVIVFVAGNNLLAEGSRAAYAFARDSGLPFSKVFSKVEKKSQVPVNAVLLTLVVQLALDAIQFGTTTGFETVVSIATEGFCKRPPSSLKQSSRPNSQTYSLPLDVSYALVLFSRVIGFFSGHVVELNGPFSFPTPISITLNIVGLVFLLFASITFNFPTTYPITQHSMNYTSAAIGVIGLISIVTWFTTGRKHFTGPGAVSFLEGENTMPDAVNAVNAVNAARAAKDEMEKN